MKRTMFGWLAGLTVMAMAAPAAAQATDSTNQSPQAEVDSILGGMGSDTASCVPTEEEKEQARQELEPEYVQRVQSNGQASADAWLNEQVMALFERQCPGQ
ncbi:hypothetical protein [Inquilinus sp. CAU 1745]|uniref:hypothetical protein n=1 Tax=Inquilinus sp. CAU 1745 TaxID=3140369 RepID=UPI00325B1628